MSSLPELLFRLKKELKDDWKHSCRVASYAKTIGVNLGLDAHQLETVWFGALVHDAGKMCIPARVLNKQGKLSDDERLMINQHPIAGWHILREFYQTLMFD